MVFFEGLDANLGQVQRRFAWHDNAYQLEQTTNDRILYDLAESEARSAKFGLWGDVESVPQWEFRKNKWRHQEATRLLLSMSKELFELQPGSTMAQDNPYEKVLVESYIPNNTSGKHGKVHIRPVAGHKYPTTLQVECSRALNNNYPVGTKFLLDATLTDRKGGGEYLYSSFRWKYDVVE